MSIVKGNTNNRPNVLPAKFVSKGDIVDTFVGTGKYNYNMQKYKTIGDLCDFCLKNIRVKRVAMGLRLKGWKFACFRCYNKMSSEEKKHIWCESKVNKDKLHKLE